MFLYFSSLPQTVWCAIFVIARVLIAVGIVWLNHLAVSVMYISVL